MHSVSGLLEWALCCLSLESHRGSSADSKIAGFFADDVEHEKINLLPDPA